MPSRSFGQVGLSVVWCRGHSSGGSFVMSTSRFTTPKWRVLPIVVRASLTIVSEFCVAAFFSSARSAPAASSRRHPRAARC